MPTATATRRKKPTSRAHKRHGTIRVGTASWSDPGFIADWYPRELPAKERLPWYAEHFDLVEVNSTFYAVPSQETVARWSEQTPRDFKFDVKLHRLLSRHSTPSKLLPRGLRAKAKTIKNRVQVTPELESGMVEATLDAVAPLVDTDKMGAFLLQLSPSFRPREDDLSELDHLLDLLDDYEVAVELRNRDWLVGEQKEKTLAYFRKRRAALVTVDGPRSEHFMVMPSEDTVTDPKLAYLRAHGRNEHGYIHGRSVAERFDYDYSEKELKEIAARAVDLSELAVETHVIFNNNKSYYAPDAAGRFRKIVSKPPAHS